MSQYSEEGIVDVEKRTKEIGQILGDPTLFPVEFLNWMKRYIEQSGITLPASSIIGGFKPGSGSVRNLAPGLILPFSGDTPPSGSLLCDGTAYVREEYPLLAAEIDVIWGSTGNPSTFKVPDLQGRTLFGASPTLALGATDGQVVTGRSPIHKHTVNEVAHGHSTTAGRLDTGATFPNGNVQTPLSGAQLIAAGGAVGTNKTNLTVGPQAAGTPVDAPSYAALLYVITTGQ